MKIRPRRIMKFSVLALLGLIGAGFLSVLIIRQLFPKRAEIISKLESRLNIPLPPHPEDTSYKFMRALDVPLPGADGKTFVDCTGIESNPVVRVDCRELLKTHRKSLDAFRAWRKTGIDRPEEMRRHSRGPLHLLEQSDWDRHTELALKHMNLTKLFLLDLKFALRNGETERVREDWNAAMDVTRILREKYSLTDQMTAIANLGLAMRSIVHFVPASATVRYQFEAQLPSPDEMGKNRALAIGGEWLFQKERLKETLEESSLPEETQNSWKAKAFHWLGLFSEKRNMSLYVSEFEKLRAYAMGSRLGTKYYDFPPGEGLSYWIRFIHDPMGAILSAVSGPAFPKYVAKMGQAVDKMHAFHIVMAARRYYLHNSEWPKTATALVPTYLKAWPKSLLSGEAMKFHGSDCVVEIHNVSGNPEKEAGEWYQCKPPMPLFSDKL